MLPWLQKPSFQALLAHPVSTRGVIYRHLNLTERKDNPEATPSAEPGTNQPFQNIEGINTSGELRQQTNVDHVFNRFDGLHQSSIRLGFDINQVVRDIITTLVEHIDHVNVSISEQR